MCEGSVALHTSSVRSCGVAFSVGEKLSGEFSQAALEFSSFFFIQRVLLKRLQQCFGGRDKDKYIGSDRHDGDPAAAPVRSVHGFTCGREPDRIIAVLFIEQTQFPGPTEPIDFEEHLVP